MAGGIGSTERVAQTTIEEWSKKVSEETERLLVLIAMLRARGRITGGHSGGQARWVVRKDEHGLNGFPDAVPVSFSRKTTKTSATLPWRGYYVDDTITLREKLEQGGPEAMIKVFSNREELMREGAIRSLAAKFFVDGNATGNEDDFHGLESFMSTGAQTATDVLATTHNDTYGGLSTAVSGITADFPRLWTPNVINTGYTPASGQRTFENYGDEYIRKAVLKGTYGQGKANKLDVFMLTQDDYESLLNLLDDKERVMIERGAGLELTKFGFENHVEIDGVGVTWDDSVPSSDDAGNTVRGYGFNFDKMEVKLLGGAKKGQLFQSKVTFNDSYRADNIFMWILGNICCSSPRHFAKLADLTPVS